MEDDSSDEIDNPRPPIVTGQAKVHRPVTNGVENALTAIFFEKRHAEKVVATFLKDQRKWGARDRRTFAETVYEIVRWWRLILKLEGIPYSDDINDPSILTRVIGRYHLWGDNLAAEETKIKGMKRQDRESIPNWLDDLGVAEMGADKWTEILPTINDPAPQTLRVNTLKMGLDELKFKLNEEGVQTDRVPGVDTALNLKERKNVFITEAFKKGCFEMQDAGSQMIAPFLKVEPGHRVIDACAGAGGKSLHLAALMQNKGRLIAMDIHDYKLEKLKIRARRAGVSVIENRVIDTTKVVKRLEASADRLLLDVPCSGLGVVRRHPDTKWKLTGDEINKLHVVQAEILERYTKMLKVGGYAVYATCSILPSENEKQIQKFLSTHKDFALEEEMHVSPLETNFDGFYAARLKRLQ